MCEWVGVHVQVYVCVCVCVCVCVSVCVCVRVEIFLYGSILYHCQKPASKKEIKVREIQFCAFDRAAFLSSRGPTNKSTTRLAVFCNCGCYIDINKQEKKTC
ncbi:hypothetical protein AMECASPLE_026397 [Ameca splendens]|uniref:Secreted protein n=1 Tax=Ameca splendens TaxID=208324 RepID=A0ABV0Y4S8_9TELE